MRGRGLQKEPTLLSRGASREMAGAAPMEALEKEAQVGDGAGAGIFPSSRNGVFDTPAPLADFLGSPHLLFSSSYAAGSSLVPPSRSTSPPLLILSWKRRFPFLPGTFLGWTRVWRGMVEPRGTKSLQAH